MSWYDNGMPIIDDPDVLATAELIRRLYAMPGCELGGPLHAMLDDGNIDDEQINSDYYEATDGRTIETYLCRHEFVMGRTPGGGIGRHVYRDELYCPEEVADLARLILDSFRRMPQPWRAAAIAWHDGTAWKRIERLAGEPLISGPPSASPEQVDDLIADLRRWMAQDETPRQKACVSIPCPPFPADPSLDAFMVASPEGRVDLSPPTWQDVVWGMRHDLLLKGEAILATPQVDVAQVLLDDAGRPPRVLYRGPTSVYETPSVQDRLDQWLSDPSWGADAAPLIVGVPADVDIDRLAVAIATCQRAGLLPATPNGILYLPEETDL